MTRQYHIESGQPTGLFAASTWAGKPNRHGAVMDTLESRGTVLSR